MRILPAESNVKGVPSSEKPAHFRVDFGVMGSGWKAVTACSSTEPTENTANPRLWSPGRPAEQSPNNMKPKWFVLHGVNTF